MQSTTQIGGSATIVVTRGRGTLELTVPGEDVIPAVNLAGDRLR